MKPPQICAVTLLFLFAPTLRAGGPIEEHRGFSRRVDESTTSVSRQASAEAAKAIDHMRKHLEEWGTVNVSQPLLYPVGGQFNLGASGEFSTFKEYYAAELTNVTAAVGQLSQAALAASVTGNFNASQYTSPPSQGTGAQTPGSTEAGNGAVANSQFPLAAPATATPTDAPVSQAKGYLDQPTFHKPGELLATAPNGNAPRSAVSQSATDKITELLLRTLANPAPPEDGSKLYLAIFQVTCNPGWRTLKGYMADVYLHWEYARHCSDGTGTVALSLSNKVPSAPTVVAMLPLVDAQNMDLRNSQRELYSLLASLSASGALSGGNAAGKGVIDYIRSYQKDSASRNAMPVVNSYSSGYGMGFRFSPSFVAISDPARKKSAAANVLIPTSFPVLAVLSMRKLDASAQDSQWPEVANTGYNELALEQTFRWLIRDRRVSLLPWDWHLPERREDERRRLKVAQQNTAAFHALGDAKAAFRSDAADLYTRADYQLLRTDFQELNYKAGTNWSYSPLRDDFLKGPKKPVITDCQPTVIDPTLDTKLTIQGENLKADGLRVFLGGQECAVISVDNEMSIVALFKAGNLTTRDHSTVTTVQDSDNEREHEGIAESPLPGRISSPGHEPLPSPAPENAPEETPPPSDVKKAYADLVVATKTTARAREVEIDLTKRREKKAKEDKIVQVTRDKGGNVVSIDLSRLGDLPTKDILDAAVRILGWAANEPKSDGETTSKPGDETKPKPGDETKPKPGGETKPKPGGETPRKPGGVSATPKTPNKSIPKSSPSPAK